MQATCNWESTHDLNQLLQSIGRYFTAYYEFRPEDGEEARVSSFCKECGGEHPLFVPTKEKKEDFRRQLQSAFLHAPSSISPNVKYFWFHARCSNCGADLVLMRS